MFEKKWIYRSDISGLGVRLKVDLVFEVGRILHDERGNALDAFDGTSSAYSCHALAHEEMPFVLNMTRPYIIPY